MQETVFTYKTVPLTIYADVTVVSETNVPQLLIFRIHGI